MAGPVIWYAVTFGCAILFYGIGIYAGKSEKPMSFWSGTSVSPSELTDVEEYNHENSIMWKLYALWYVSAGLAHIWSIIVAVVILVMSCTVGIGLLIGSYNRIYKKYKVH